MDCIIPPMDEIMPSAHTVESCLFSSLDSLYSCVASLYGTSSTTLEWESLLGYFPSLCIGLSEDFM